MLVPSLLGPLRRAVCVFFALLGTATLPLRGAEPCPVSPEPHGAWAQAGGGIQLLFEPDRIVVRENGHLRAATILRREPCKLIVRDEGLRSTWSFTGSGNTLHFDGSKGTVELTRLPETPPDFDISPFPLPPAKPVPAETVQEIATELKVRDERFQKAAKAKDQELTELAAADSRYLREVVSRYGWLDIPRFGKAAAAAAVFIAKHADDVRLMQDAAPIAEQDARENGGGKELISVLVDSLLITMGHKQKYGTQITEDAHGKPFVIPVEDPAKVDEARKALGILPWAEYLKRASQALYNGAPIRIPGPEE
jgi:hypothetical protein